MRLCGETGRPALDCLHDAIWEIGQGGRGAASSADLNVIPDLVVHDGAAFASSLDVARVFGKRHDNVLFKIDALIAQAGGGLLGFKETPHVEPQSRQTYRAYEISRDGFALLAMGFTGAKALRFSNTTAR